MILGFNDTDSSFQLRTETEDHATVIHLTEDDEEGRSGVTLSLSSAEWLVRALTYLLQQVAADLSPDAPEAP